MNIMERNAAAYVVYCMTGHGGENIDRVIEILEAAPARSDNPLLAFVMQQNDLASEHTQAVVAAEAMRLMRLSFSDAVSSTFSANPPIRVESL